MLALRQSLKLVPQIFVAGLLVVLLAFVFPVAEALAQDSLPAEDVWQLSDRVFPNWSQTSFADFAPVDQGGSISDEFNKSVGYDLSRTWKAGDTIDEIYKLGDLTEKLGAQRLSLRQIRDLVGFDLNQVSISNFPLLANQSLERLRSTVPFLAEVRIADVPPIDELVKIAGRNLIDRQLQKSIKNLKLGEAIDRLPELGDLTLNQIDLKEFSLDDIPNIERIPLQNFPNWQNALFSEVPGLRNVVLGQMPNPLALAGGLVARIDSIYGEAETKRNNTISGSLEEGFRVPCEQECAYIELDDLENEGRKIHSAFEGKQWISGKYQEVEGGYGILKYLPSPEGFTSGKEPTGRLPFGDWAKLVIWEPDETKDRVSTRLFFRICAGWGGCTPYNQFSLTFLDYKVDNNIFIGLLDEQGGATSDPSEASPQERVAAAEGRDVRLPGGYSVPGKNPGATNSPCQANAIAGDINLDILAEAVASIESQGSGGYEAIGVYTCADKGKNCGRAIGAHQTMSYHPAMVAEVTRVSGGKEWLQKLNAGYNPTKAEIMQYYPPEAQDRAFQSEMHKLVSRAQTQIDPKTGQPFTGDRVIERATQMWFGGPSSTIDGGDSDALGRLSLYSYGVQARKYYKSRRGTTSIKCQEVAQQQGKPSNNLSGNGNATGKYNNPAAGYRVTSEFGPRSSPCQGCSSNHRGIDIGTPRGTPIKAADGGTVVFAKTRERYGNVVIVDHGGGRQTRYAHLDRIGVKAGEKVSQGQNIGAAGSTGAGTGAHLHFEVREGAVANRPFSGTAVNPRKYIKFGS